MRGARATAAHLPLLVTVLAAALLLPACGTSHLAFRQDTRLHFDYPRARQKVHLPVTVRWSVHDFEVTGPTDELQRHAGYFGVFVDRAPQPPGQPLTWVGRNDRNCRRADGCPNPRYLADHGVYAVTTPSFPIDVLRPPPSGQRGKDMHEVTVVLLDSTGRRVGETAFNLQFGVARP